MSHLTPDPPVESDRAITPPVSEGGATTCPTVLPDATAGPRDSNLPHELRILQSLRRITRALEIHSRELAAGHNVTGPQLVCLLAIKEKGPLTATAIACEVHLSASTVVGILDRLEEKGLAYRERDRQDRRQIHVLVTPKGVDLAERAPSPLQETLAIALNNLPELERVAIALSLERVVTLMETKQIDPLAGPVSRSEAGRSGGALPTLTEGTR